MNYKENYPPLPLAEKLQRIQKGLTTEPFFSAVNTLLFVNAPILSAANVIDDVQMTKHKSAYFALKTEFPHAAPNDITFGAVAEKLAASLNGSLQETIKILANVYFNCFYDATLLNTNEGKPYIGDHSLMRLNEFLKSVPCKEYEDLLEFIEGTSYEKNAFTRKTALNYIGHPFDETSLADIYAAFNDRNHPEDNFQKSSAKTIRTYYGPLIDLFVIPIAEISEKKIDEKALLTTRTLKTKGEEKHEK